MSHKIEIPNEIGISSKDEDVIRSLIPKWHQELKKLLSKLPDTVDVTFNNEYLIPDTGTGGFADAPGHIILAFDPEHEDKSSQLADLRGSYFHECYHLVQGWTGEETAGDGVTALDNAVMEGAATIFEKTYTDSNPPWSDYSAIGNMEQAVEDISKLGTDFDYKKWKFYDPESDTRWILYRAGSYIIDRALKDSPGLKIEDLATKSTEEVMDIAKL